MRKGVLCPIVLTLLICEVAYCRHRKGVGPEHPDEGSEYDVVIPPSFVPGQQTEFYVLEGNNARLTCSVRNLGTKKLIWRRHSQPNPLTIGRDVFSFSDNRLSVENVPFHEEWALIITQVRREDADHYECQVSTKDRNMKMNVTLYVQANPDRQRISTTKAPQIVIYGKTVLEKGSRLKLHCNATDVGHPPDKMDWFFSGSRISTDHERGIRIDERVSLMDKTIFSTLVIDNMDLSNAGIYLCRASGLHVNSTRVDVLNADSNSNVKRGTEKDSSGKLKDGRRYGQGRLRDDNQENSSNAIPTSLSITYSFFLLSIVAVRVLKIEIFPPT